MFKVTAKNPTAKISSVKPSNTIKPIKGNVESANLFLVNDTIIVNSKEANNGSIAHLFDQPRSTISGAYDKPIEVVTFGGGQLVYSGRPTIKRDIICPTFQVS